MFDLAVKYCDRFEDMEIFFSCSTLDKFFAINSSLITSLTVLVDFLHEKSFIGKVFAGKFSL